MSAKVGKRRYEMYMLVHDQLRHRRHGCCQDASVGVGLVGRVVGLRDAMSVREIRQKDRRVIDDQRACREYGTKCDRTHTE